ncbi:MAG TPA: sugar ABC transporter permease [Candidatus Methylomirabilis sp.]|nr:sugar ABC transporter permease [Candidatus Methylomirabilis sp.]
MIAPRQAPRLGKGGRITGVLDRRPDLVFPAPSLLAFLLILGFPIAFVLYVSLHDWPISPTIPAAFLGLGNYTALLGSARFWGSLWITFYFTFLAVGGELLFGLAIALLFHREFRGRGLARVILIMPMAATPVAMSLIWNMMMEPTLGMLNYLLSWLWIPPLLWAADPRWAIPSLALIDVWFWTPFMALIISAGLQTIPGEIVESARLDGATAIRLFRHITLPLVRPHLVMAVILRTILALKTFDHIFVITGGGPLRASETLNLYTFLEGFEFFHMGYASALAVALTLVILAVSALLARLRAREWSY